MATDTNVEMKQSRYEETRRRITRFRNGYNISDREIIEYLAEEIEQNRERIRKLTEMTEQRNKEIYSERNTYSCGIDGGNEDYTVTRWYEDGVLIKEEIKPVRTIKNDDENKCPPIVPKLRPGY